EQRDRLFCYLNELVRRALGFRERTEELALDQGPQLEPLVAGGRRALQRVGEHLLGTREVTGAHQRAAELGQRRDAGRVIGGKERGCAREQRHCCGHVAARERSMTRLSEQRPAAFGKSPCIVVDSTELVAELE